MLAEKIAAIKAELMADLLDQKSVLKELSEPVLKKVLTSLVKKGLMPLIKAYFEETENKLDDLVWGTIDDKIEEMITELIVQIKL